MKKATVVVMGLVLIGLVTVPGAFAKGGKGKKNAAPAFTTVPSDVYKQYDKNANGMLEADEKETFRADFTKEPTGALKVYDTNTDAKLSDDEIAAIPATRQVESPTPVKEKKHKKNK